MRLSLIIFLLACISCTKNDRVYENKTEVPVRAVDLSFLPQMQDAGFEYRDSQGQSIDVLPFLSQKGVNCVRIRLWHTPADQHSSLEEVATLVEALRGEGFQIWISVHYSDTWADPGHQSKPALWEGQSYSTLRDSVSLYTERVVRALSPDIIQMGNEVNDGFLWPTGRRSFITGAFHDLLKAGIEAVRSESPETKIMLHYAGMSGAYEFYDEVDSLDFDIMGLSYYPIWHGSELSDLRAMGVLLKSEFQRDFMIAEFAYPFTLEWADWTNNIVGLSEQLILPEFPANKEGQENYVQAVEQLCRDAEAEGFCYWAPDWVAFDGPESTAGSPWENQALFDFEGKSTPALDVFDAN